MKVNYSDEKILLNNPSIFLAGPTPRKIGVKSWRPEAIKILNNLGFNGTVYIPEHATKPKYDYLDQVEWEKAGLENADIIVFWVPRELKDMPAFTTNTEFGYYLASKTDQVVYGRPKDAPKNRYLDWLYKTKTGKTPFNTLEETLTTAVNILSPNTINEL